MKEQLSKINDHLQYGKVANPKFTLYAFHLHYNLAQGTRNPVKHPNHLWLKCQELGKQLGIPKLEGLLKLIEENSQKSSRDGEILSQRFLNFTAIEHKIHLHLRGEVVPLRIHDTYAVDLTLRYSEPEVQFADLRGLNHDNYLLPSQIDASLGQTLVLFAQPLSDIQDAQAFADACVTALLSAETVDQLQVSYQSRGKLLGSPIFEYNNDAESPKEQCHILIWLNTNPKTTQLEDEGAYYYPLINLLNCRSKIIYARSEAIWCYQQARVVYSDLESKVKEFNAQKNQSVASKFEKFNEWLNEISEISFNYARYLRDLQLHKTTIQTNSKNYRLYLEKLNKIYVEEDNLEFWSSFLELAENTFVEQMSTDLSYLTPGQNLFDQLINTIRGTVEIEQAKRDRSLEQTIQVLGVGLGAGAIVSSVVATHIDKPFAPISSHKPFHPMVSSLFWSVLAVLFFGWLAWLRTQRK